MFRWNNEVIMETALLVFAGLMGAAGVVLAAASAHGAPGSGLDNAAYMLLFHAAAMLGGALLAGDVAARAYIGSRLFPMAAPTGGVILIASWLALALAALTAR